MKTEQTGTARSVAALNLAVLLFGLAAVIGRFVQAPSVVIAGGRVICSAAVLLALSLLSRTPLRLANKRDLGLAVFVGLVLALHWTTFFQAIQVSSVAMGTITFSAFPLFLTAVSYTHLKLERWKRQIRMSFFSPHGCIIQLKEE